METLPSPDLKLGGVLSIRPFHDLTTDEFRSIITANGLRLPAPLHDVLQSLHDAGQGK